jgi:N-acetylglucosaminyldiphosphoundecaprenol N-acetyl-beta-D-mannosaminyltransferase
MKGKEAASVMFMGVKISNVNYSTTYNTLSSILNTGGKGYVCLNDVGNIMEATRDEELRAAINEATFSLADGMPLARYAQLAGCTVIERLSGAHLMKQMLSENDGYKHFLLGDTEKTLDRVISEAKRLNHNIKIVGHSPPFRAFCEEDNRQMLHEVRKENPDIIWVSFGGVKQEKWMHQQINSLDRGIMIGAGAAFKWLIGEIPTPPQLAQTLGFQWLYRVVHELKKDPKALTEFFVKRRYFQNRFSFLANLPHEVTAARKHLKQNTRQ